MAVDTAVFHIAPSVEDVTTIAMPTTIVKRDGRSVSFDAMRITSAVTKCFAGLSTRPTTDPAEITMRVLNILSSRGDAPTVEGVQDVVELVLQSSGEFEAAKHYILYRAEHTKIRALRPATLDVIERFREADQYFPTALQKFQYFDKYARFDHDAGRRETWIETVHRSTDFLFELVDKNVSVTAATSMVLDGTLDAVEKAILEMRAMPSMRLLAMAGPAARRQNAAIFNCAFVAADSVDAFGELLLLSMSGCGVGYSVERRHVDKLPKVAQQGALWPLNYEIEDSTEGWVAALKHGIAAWFAGEDVNFIYDAIRPAGSVLRVKGGRASGPDPLRNALVFIRERMLSRQGGYLRPLDVHDMMCQIGNAAVSGGVRRTALISLFDMDDEEMLNCKVGDFETHNSQRWNANNSAVIPEAGIGQQQFLEMWTAMARSGRGEPGFVSRQAMKNTLPERREWHPDFGTNPCFAPGTLVWTSEGHYPIEQLVGKSVTIWDGTIWRTVDNFRATAHDQEILKVTLHDGSVIRATPYHQMILTDGSTVDAFDLAPGDKLAMHNAPVSSGTVRMAGAYAAGFLTAEGTIRSGTLALDVYQPKWMCVDRLSASISEVSAGAVNTNAIVAVGANNTTVSNPIRKTMTGLAVRAHALSPWVEQFSERLPSQAFRWSYATKLDFLAGVFDGDGTAIDSDHGYGYQLTSVHHDWLLDVQALLKTIGVYSHVNKSKSGGPVDFGPERGGWCITQDLYRLSISQRNAVELSSLVQFERLPSFADRKCTYDVKPRFNTVVSVEPDGVEANVYCCTVPESHRFALTTGVLVGNCGEVVLRPMQMCNLSICVARSDDTLDSLAEKVRIATIIGTIQSLATHLPGLRPEWGQNMREERLLGVDITGQRDCPLLDDEYVLYALRQVAISTNAEWADRFGINHSAAITTVKPSGNSGVLLNCSSGLHARWAPYYERNVRVAATSPIYKVLNDAGVPMQPENGQEAWPEPNTWVASFVVKSPDGTLTRKDLSAVDQASYWLKVKQNWTEHNPSVSIYYRPDEVIPLMTWVWEHIEQIGGMSFLPADDAKYAKLPYIEITQEEYEARAATFPDIDFSKLVRYEQSDMTTASQELACQGNSCET